VRMRCAYQRWLGGLCLFLLTLSGCGLTDWYQAGQGGSRGMTGMSPEMLAFNDGMLPPPEFNLPPDMSMPPDFNFSGGFSSVPSAP
jgi:hypothetical protein